MERPEDPLSGAAEPFLARWSRRKCEAREQGEGAREAESPPASSAPEPPAEPVPRVLTDADMPPLDSLRFDDDWSGFLSPGVSEQLRGEALRRLFSSPELNVTDGLDSYSGDYTAFEALGDTVTADMRHRIERLLDATGTDGPVKPAPDPAVAAGEAPDPTRAAVAASGAADPTDAAPASSEAAGGWTPARPPGPLSS